MSTAITQSNFQTAINEWVADPTTAEATYGHIKDWDTSAVTNMDWALYNKALFNDDISSWNVSNVTSMKGMFYTAVVFNTDISSWDVSAVTDMYYMFFYAREFNQNITNWNTTSVTDFTNMFNNATLMIANQGAPKTPDQSYFNQVGLTPITQANIQTAVDAWVADPTAAEATYGHIRDWDTSSVTDMSELFSGKTTFNDDISGWDVSNVTSMGAMFYNATAFNQPIGSWDVSKVDNMGGMFYTAQTFNQPIGNWNVSKVDSMYGMFYNAEIFNQDISGWDVSDVTNMRQMFNNAESFTNDIKDWNTSNVTDMSEMFDGATLFKIDLARWVVGGSTILTNMFRGSRMGTSGDSAPNQDTPPLSYFNQAPCFNQDTLILCPTGNICVKDLKEGDEVVSTSGIKKILRIDSKTRQFNNTNNVSNTMYRMKKTDDMTHDLLVTGGHAILLDNAESYYHGRSELFPEDKKVDGKYPIIAGMYHKFEKETEPKEHTIYHIAIDGDQNRYGLFANGVLMESWDKRQTSM